MKNYYILIAIFAIICGWVNNYWFSLLILLAATFYYVKKIGKPFFYVFLLCLVSIVRFEVIPKPMHAPSATTGKIIELKKNHAVVEVESQKVVVFGIENAWIDDVVSWDGKYQKLRSIHSMNGYHFPTNMKKKGIIFSSQAKDTKIIKHKETIRNALFRKSNQIKNLDNRIFVQEMLFQFVQDDKSFLWVSSGMHISYLAFIVTKILSRFMSTDNSKIAGFCVIALLGYTTVFSAAILRTLCFQLIGFIFSKHSRQDRVGCSAYLCIMLAPYMSNHIALLLPLAFQLGRIFYQENAKTIRMTLLICIPFQLYYYHQCNIFQIVIFKYIRKIYSFIYMYVLIGTCFQFLLLFMPLLLLLEKLLLMIEQFGSTFYYTPHMIWLIVWSWYSLKLFEKPTRKSYLVIVILALFSQYGNYINPIGEISILDVGQGDCALIKLPFQKGVMLIDIMGSLNKNIPKDIIVPILRGKGINKIDQVILTHDDLDHSGGLKQLQELMPVDKVITQKKLDLNLGELKIHNLTKDIIGSDANDNSIVPYFVIDNIKYAFMGDVSQVIEEQIIEQYPLLKIDVLKVGHHGSKTSSSSSFVHQIHPKLSLISSGRNNRYNHPNKEVLETLENEQSTILNTQWNGDISIYFSKYLHFFKTAEQEFGIIK